MGIHWIIPIINSAEVRPLGLAVSLKVFTAIESASSSKIFEESRRTWHMLGGNMHDIVLRRRVCYGFPSLKFFQLFDCQSKVHSILHFEIVVLDLQ